MLFNSFEYLAVFLPAVLLLFFLASALQQNLLARLVLVLASLFFYAYWKLGYLPLLLASMVVNYSIGEYLRGFAGARRRYLALLLGLCFNLGLLGYYKYFDFLIFNVNHLAGTDFSLGYLLLPLAISFYTFQQIAYLVDSYRRRVAAPGLLNYCLFVCFFPQLIAGPIVHHSKVVPQFNSDDFLRLDLENLRVGLFYIALGFFKKTVLADALVPVVGSGFANASSLAPHEVAFVTLAYTFQLYFDFSGYTDMAMGAARCFNIRLPLNFNSPYRSRNIREFWRRWHITLNDFMTRYVYGPLRGRAREGWRPLLAIFLTFVLVGVWHGAGWNFVLFGIAHALAVLFVTVTAGRFDWLPAPVAIALTFAFFVLSLVLFRSADAEAAFAMYSALFDFAHYAEHGSASSAVAIEVTDVALVLLSTLICFAARNSNDLAGDDGLKPRMLPLSAAVFILALSINTSSSEFIYFNF
jgi:D-alanyl-lipoteichoic acid acyltransferase DltB (MBOAT superfamily)